MKDYKMETADTLLRQYEKDNKGFDNMPLKFVKFDKIEEQVAEVGLNKAKAQCNYLKARQPEARKEKVIASNNKLERKKARKQRENMLSLLDVLKNTGLVFIATFSGISIFNVLIYCLLMMDSAGAKILDLLKSQGLGWFVTRIALLSLIVAVLVGIALLVLWACSPKKSKPAVKKNPDEVSTEPRSKEEQAFVDYYKAYKEAVNKQYNLNL